MRISGTTQVMTREFIRYLFAGGTAFVVDYGTLYLLVEAAAVNYLVAATLSFLLGTFVNYHISIRWVFSFRRVDSRSREFAIFATIGAIGVLLNGGLIFFLVELLQIHYLLAKLTATAVVLLFNFLVRRWLLFSNPSSSSLDSAVSASPDQIQEKCDG